MTNPQNDLLNHPAVLSNLALLEVWLQAQIAYQQLPGATVGIVYDQEIVYANGFGFADVDSKRPATPNSIFRIASHSKLFTAISIMQLRDQGKLNLDDPVTKYLPWFNVQNSYPEAPPITVRHLLTHTSGLPREAGSGYWIDFEFPTRSEVAQRLGQLETIFPSETRWKYSNLALTLAGEVVAQVSEQPYADYVQQHILDPLQMDSTSVVFPAKHREQLVTGYGRRMPDGTRERFPFVDAQGMAAATGLSSSVADMARFISWQFRLLKSGKSELLKASTLREMQRIHWLDPTWQSGWGLGFSITRKRGRELIGHGGGYPGYRTNTRISPKENVGVIVFMNALDSQPLVVSDRIFEWLTPALSKAAAGDQAAPPDPGWRNLEGTYRNIFGDFHVLPLAGKLALIDPTVSNPKAEALTLEPAGENLFRLDGEDGYSELGELIEFELGSDGRAARVKIGVNWAERVTY